MCMMPPIFLEEITSMAKFLLAVCVGLILSGCARYAPLIPIDETTHNIQVELKDEIVFNGEKVLGLHQTVYRGDPLKVVHLIYLLRNLYPLCLQHEIRHVLEGRFHDDVPSEEDCFK